jgi:hypothetical protein
MQTQEAELLRQFRRNPQEARDMIVKMAKISADLFQSELEAALESIDNPVPQLND